MWLTIFSQVVLVYYIAPFRTYSKTWCPRALYNPLLLLFRFFILLEYMLPLPQSLPQISPLPPHPLPCLPLPLVLVWNSSYNVLLPVSLESARSMISSSNLFWIGLIVSLVVILVSQA